MGVFTRGLSTGYGGKENTTMKTLSRFVNGKAFAFTMLILMFALAVGLFQATIDLAK